MKNWPALTRVKEIQGLYGPLQILEGRIQQIWGLQQMQEGAWETLTGKRIRVKNPGRLNRGGGPDYLEAIIELDGVAMAGSVEIHLYREDWWRHGHHLDPAYDSVILHVVLFAGGMDNPVRTTRGRMPEEWVMGPWMREDLESVTGGDPGLFGELAPDLKEWMEADAPETVRERLGIGAGRRWQDKVSMARCLLDHHGWEGGLHRMTLFYLGFPFNRRVFFEMAETYPREAWAQAEILGLLKSRWESSVRWSLGRPANRPARRLEQYISLNSAAPDWPQRLERLPSERPHGTRDCIDDETARVRREWGFRAWRVWLQEAVLAGSLNGSLADRLWIDVFLPALATRQRLSPVLAELFWFHAPPGLFPDGYRDLLRLAGIQQSAGWVLANGWVQGLYWADDQLRIERVRSATGRLPRPSRA